jgi:ubiquitin C-terminal hydrolase
MIKGIPNIGNTCFLNTCLQILLQTPELDFLDQDREQEKEKEKKESNDPHLWIAWKKWKATMVSDPNTFDFREFQTFFQTIQFIAQKKGHTLFSGYVQNDLSEFLLFFMDTLHESFKRPRSMKIEGVVENETDVIAKECYQKLQEIYQNEYSEIIDIFYGVSLSTIYATETIMRRDQKDPIRKMSSKPETFFLLDLPIPSSLSPLSPLSLSPLSIYSCFDHYISPEYMENGWIDETTKETKSVYKKIDFWNFSKILVITLQRFQTNLDLSQGQIHISKKTDLVDFPIETLDLSKYVVGYNARKYIYDLYGIVNHIGDVHGGHYTAFVLGPGQEKKWYHCNDDRIEIVQDPRQMITPMAYVFFYRIRSA